MNGSFRELLDQRTDGLARDAALGAEAQPFVAHPVALDLGMVRVGFDLERHEVAEVELRKRLEDEELPTAGELRRSGGAQPLFECSLNACWYRVTTRTLTRPRFHTTARVWRILVADAVLEPPQE